MKILDKPDKIYISTLIQQLTRIIEEFPTGPPEIDPIKELKINDLNFVDLYTKKKNILLKMEQSKCHRCPRLVEQVFIYFIFFFNIVISMN